MTVTAFWTFDFASVLLQHFRLLLQEKKKNSATNGLTDMNDFEVGSTNFLDKQYMRAQDISGQLTFPGHVHFLAIYISSQNNNIYSTSSQNNNI